MVPILEYLVRVATLCLRDSIVETHDARPLLYSWDVQVKRKAAQICTLSTNNTQSRVFLETSLRDSNIPSSIAFPGSGRLRHATERNPPQRHLTTRNRAPWLRALRLHKWTSRIAGDSKDGCGLLGSTYMLRYSKPAPPGCPRQRIREGRFTARIISMTLTADRRPPQRITGISMGTAQGRAGCIQQISIGCKSRNSAI